MIKILFVCHGNICRSPMAEFLMKDLVRQAGLQHQFSIASVGTSDEECGNPVYPPVQRLLQRRGICCKGKTARQLRREDYACHDYIVGMDEQNRRSMLRLFGGDPEGKVSLLLDFTAHPRSVADPWYTRDFPTAEKEIDEGCRALLQFIMSKAPSHTFP